MPETSGPLQALFLRFGLPAPTAFRPVDSGLLNRSYQITSPGRRYFLKHYLPWRGIGSGLPDEHGRKRSADRTLRWQHEAVIRLQAAGLPAVAPLRDLHGRTVAYVRGRPFAVFPWNDGVHRHGRHMQDVDAFCLGAVLADIHTGLARVLPQVPQPLFVATTSEQRAVAEAEQLLALVDAGAGVDVGADADASVDAGVDAVQSEMDALSTHRLRERLALIPEVAHLRPAPNAVGTVGYIHGDFHAGNVMWSGMEPGSRVTAVVDWEKTAVAPCGDEVVSTALVFFTGEYSGQLDLDLVRAFIGGYVAARPHFSERELTDSVRRVWWERLTDFWILTWHYQHADHRADSLFPATAALVPWWTENYAKVLDAFLYGAATATGKAPRR